MANAKQYVEELTRAVSAGIFTDEQKEDFYFMLFVLEEYRAYKIQQDFLNAKVPPHYTLYQEIVLQNPSTPSEADFGCGCVDWVEFDIPKPIAINDQMDGMGYIGTLRRNFKYDRVRTRVELSGLLRHPTTLPHRDYIVVYTNPSGKLEVYGDKGIKRLMVEMIAEHPSLVTGFRLVNDYPMNATLMASIKEAMYKNELMDIARRYEDEYVNSSDTKIQQQHDIRFQ